MSRGQVHTLEAIIAGLLLLTSVLFALQMTAVTPLSASTSSQHVENQLQASIEGVLSGAAHSGELEPAVLYWNSTANAFRDVRGGEKYYTSAAPPNAFGQRLERAFDQRGIAYNVYVSYYTDFGTRERLQMVYRGQPTDNAVRAAKTVVLTDDDQVRNATGQRRPLDGGTFYATDAFPANPTYNVLRVEVVAWRI